MRHSRSRRNLWAQRFLWIAALGALTGLVAGQGEPDTQLPPPDFRPQALIRVEKSSLGPDVIEVTMMDPDYPATELRSRLAALETYHGQAPRGLQMYVYEIPGTTPPIRSLRAKFALDGIWREDGTLYLQPLARMLAGVAEPHSIRDAIIIFDGLVPSANTPQSFESKALKLTGQSMQQPPGVEYRLTLLDQNPEQIVIPVDQVATIQTESTPVASETGLWSWLLIGGIVIAGLSLGALVYFAVLRPGSRRMN
ncbi:MAG: hypothetical protein ACK4XJ_09595 [Fimbriimonadaceae bacterium]